jgi:hypothetical protein
MQKPSFIHMKLKFRSRNKNGNEGKIKEEYYRKNIILMNDCKKQKIRLQIVLFFILNKNKMFLSYFLSSFPFWEKLFGRNIKISEMLTI